MQAGEALAQLAGLGVAHVHAVADRERVRRRADQRRLHLAGALLAIQAQPGGEVRARQARGVGRARGEVAAAERGDHAAAGAAHDRQREERRRARA